MQRLIAVARQEVLLVRSEWIPTALYFVMPIAIVAFVQGAFTIFFEFTDPGSDIRGASLAAPGLATMFGFMSLATFGHFFLAEYGWGTWNRLRSAGTTPLVVMTGKVGVNYVKQLLLFVVVMSISAAVFGLRVEGSIAALIVVELLVAGAISGYGVLACAFSRSQAEYNAFAYLGALVMAGLGGALTPFETLPSWARAIAPLTPVYWAVRAFDEVIIQGSGLRQVAFECAMLVLFAVGLGLVGWLLFDPDRQRATWA